MGDQPRLLGLGHLAGVGHGLQAVGVDGQRGEPGGHLGPIRGEQGGHLGEGHLPVGMGVVRPAGPDTVLMGE